MMKGWKPSSYPLTFDSPLTMMVLMLGLSEKISWRRSTNNTPLSSLALKKVDNRSSRSCKRFFPDIHLLPLIAAGFKSECILAFFFNNKGCSFTTAVTFGCRLLPMWTEAHRLRVCFPAFALGLVLSSKARNFSSSTLTWIM